MSEQFSILLGNHSRLEAGQTDGVWLSMPATTEQLHDAMRNIGVTAENPQDLFVGGFANTEQCPFDVPLSVIQSGSIDELNYLGKLLEMQRNEDKRSLRQQLRWASMPEISKTLSILHKTLTAIGFIPPSKAKKITATI